MTTPTATPSADALTRYRNVHAAYVATTDPETEDAIADILEVIWYQMTEDEREQARHPPPGDSVAAIIRELREYVRMLGPYNYEDEATVKQLMTEAADTIERLQSAPQPPDPYPWLARGAIPPREPPFPG